MPVFEGCVLGVLLAIDVALQLFLGGQRREGRKPGTRGRGGRAVLSNPEATSRAIVARKAGARGIGIRGGAQGRAGTGWALHLSR